MMTIYRVHFVDRLHNTIIGERIAIGASESEALVDAGLPLDARVLKRKDQLAIVTEYVGNYEPIERTYSVNVEDKEDPKDS